VATLLFGTPFGTYAARKIATTEYFPLIENGVSGSEYPETKRQFQPYAARKDSTQKEEKSQSFSLLFLFIPISTSQVAPQ
jgi:hypothetical protein